MIGKVNTHAVIGSLISYIQTEWNLFHLGTFLFSFFSVYRGALSARADRRPNNEVRSVISHKSDGGVEQLIVISLHLRRLWEDGLVKYCRHYELFATLLSFPDDRVEDMVSQEPAVRCLLRRRVRLPHKCRAGNFQHRIVG